MTRRKSASAKSASDGAKRSGKKAAGRSAGKKKRPLPAERTQADGGPPGAGGVTEQALRESEHKYRALVEQSLQGLVVVQDFRIVFTNQAFAEISGYTVEELMSLSPEQVRATVHPEDRALVWGRFEDRLAGKPVAPRYEYRFIRKDGSVRWLEMFATPIEYEGRRAGQWAIVDVTDRKRAEKKVEENERFLQEVFDSIQDGITIRDRDLRVIQTNRWVERKFPSEMPLAGKKCYRAFQKRESPCPWCPAIPTMETGKSHSQVVPYPSAENPTGWLELTAFPMEDAEGNVVGAIEHVRDITERKRTEERLRFLSSAVEQTADGIAVADLQGNLLFVNDAFAEMHGYRSEELVGRHLTVFHLPEQMPSVEAASRQLQERGDFSGEIWHARRDGTVFPTWMRNSLLRDEAGNPVGMIGTVRNITERKRAVKALRAEKERAQTYLDIAGVILVAMGADERVTLINRKGCEVLGRSEDEVVGENWLDIAIPERERERVRRTFAMLMAGDIEPAVYVENPVVARDGTERIIGWRNVVLQDPVGNVVGTLSSGEDVTERKRMEEALLESEERFRAVFENAEDGILVADRETRRLTDANRAICEMLGYPRDELLRLRADNIHPTEDVPRVMETFERQARGEFTLGANIPVRRKDGSVCYADINSSPVTITGEPYMIGVFRDITDRRRAEEELANAQALLLAAIEQTPAGIVIAEPPDVRIRVANSAALGIRGKTGRQLTDIPMELHSKNWQLSYPDGSRSRGEDLPLSRAILRGETSENVEMIMRRSDGSERWVLVNAAPVRNAQGQIVAGVAVFPDITERKHEAEVLDFERRQLMSIFDSIDEVVYVSDPKTYEVLYANRSLREVYGDAVGRPCYRVLQGRESPCPECTNDRILGKNVGQAYIWEEQNRVTGRWYRCINRAVRWPDGRMVRYEMAIDVTERKRAEEALRESEEKFRGIAERSFDIIFTMDLQGNITYISPSAEGVFLYEPEEMLGRPFTDFAPESEVPRALRRLSEVAAGEEIGVIEAEGLCKDGSRISIELNSSPILEGGRLVGIQGIIRDVTERNAAEEELRRTEAQLAHVGRLSTMGELVGGIAHEVSQPLYSVLNFAKASRNVLTAEKEPNLDDLRDWSEQIAAAAARAGQIIARLRSFVRRTEPQRAPANINQVVEESVELVAFETRRHQVAVTLELGETLPVVHVDRVQIQQVLVNLLRNAYEALDQSPAGTRRVIVRTSQPGEFVEIAVADNGSGLPPKDDLNPFDAFATSKPGGLGIGLAISRTIIETHGGDLWAASTPDGGATFHFTLPISTGGPSDGTRTDRIRRG
ncbi:MAG TPA: PAS domain S-box protein [Thermoguttaceae bacterium]|nr:PAS domain S-box protein [Thermoguttaceae bacterium]